MDSLENIDRNRDLTSLRRYSEHKKSLKQIKDSNPTQSLDTDDILQYDSEKGSVLSDYSIDLDVSIDDSDISNSYTDNSYSSIRSLDSDDSLQSLSDKEYESSDCSSHMDGSSDESDLSD